MSPVIACFVRVYGADKGRGACAEMEPLLMMRPPWGDWSRMMRKACCVQRKGCKRRTAARQQGVAASASTALPDPGVCELTATRLMATMD